MLNCLSVGLGPAAQAVMSAPEVSLVLATGGPSMVRAAYSSGHPALGVGAGNTPAVIDETADVQQAVSSILLSKASRVRGQARSPLDGRRGASAGRSLRSPLRTTRAAGARRPSATPLQFSALGGAQLARPAAVEPWLSMHVPLSPRGQPFCPDSIPPSLPCPPTHCHTHKSHCHAPLAADI